jgi:hypothetical protein
VTETEEYEVQEGGTRSRLNSKRKCGEVEDIDVLPEAKH